MKTVDILKEIVAEEEGYKLWNELIMDYCNKRVSQEYFERIYDRIKFLYSKEAMCFVDRKMDKDLKYYEQYRDAVEWNVK